VTCNKKQVPRKAKQKKIDNPQEKQVQRMTLEDTRKGEISTSVYS
jgi:hypothetical protein